MSVYEKLDYGDSASILADTFIDLSKMHTDSESRFRSDITKFAITQNYRDYIEMASHAKNKKKVNSLPQSNMTELSDFGDIFKSLKKNHKNVYEMKKTHVDTSNVPYVSTISSPKINSIDQDVQLSSAKGYSTTYINLLKSTQNGDSFDNNMNIFRTVNNNKTGFFVKKYSTVKITDEYIDYVDSPPNFCYNDNNRVSQNIGDIPDNEENLKTEISSKISQIIELNSNLNLSDKNQFDRAKNICEIFLNDIHSLNNTKTTSKYSFIFLDNFPRVFKGNGVLNNNPTGKESDENKNSRLYDHILFHTLFSSKQRSALFEKHLGHSDPLVIIAPISSLKTKIKWDTTNVILDTDTEIILKTQMISNAINQTTSYGNKVATSPNLHSRYVFFDTLRNIIKNDQNTQEKQLYNSPIFFDFCVDKISAVVVQKEKTNLDDVSTLFDYSMSNSSIMEHYVGSYCECFLKSWIAKNMDKLIQKSDVPTIELYFSFRPSIYLSALCYKMLKKTQDMFYKKDGINTKIHDYNYHLLNETDKNYELISFDIMGGHVDDLEETYKYIPPILLKSLTENSSQIINPVEFKSESKRAPFLIKKCLKTMPYIKKIIDRVFSNIFESDNKDISFPKIKIKIGYLTPFIKIINTPLDYKIDRYIQNNWDKGGNENPIFVKSGIQTLTEISQSIMSDDYDLTQFFGIDNKNRNIDSIPSIKSEFKDYFKYSLKIFPKKFDPNATENAFCNGRFIVMEDVLGTFSKMIGFQDDFDLFEDIYSFENLLLHTPLLDKILKLESLNLPSSEDGLKKYLYGYIGYLDIDVNNKTNENDIRASIIRKIKSLKKEEIVQLLHLVSEIHETLKTENYSNVTVEINIYDMGAYSNLKTNIGYILNEHGNIDNIGEKLGVMKDKQSVPKYISSVVSYVKKTLRVFKFVSGIIKSNIINIVNIWKRDFDDFFVVKLKSQTPEDVEIKTKLVKRDTTKKGKTKKKDDDKSSQEDIDDDDDDSDQEDSDIENASNRTPNVRMNVVRSLLSKNSIETLNGRFKRYQSDTNKYLLNEHRGRKIRLDSLDRLSSLIKTRSDNFYPGIERKMYFEAIKILDEELASKYIEEFISNMVETPDENNYQELGSENNSSFKEKLFSGFKSFFGLFVGEKGVTKNVIESNKEVSITDKTRITTETDIESRININICVDEIDILIDICSVCGFFKNYVLLDHGYTNSHKNLLGVGIFEPETAILTESIWNEVISGTANSNIISPIKGLAENFISEYRLCQKSFLSCTTNLYSGNNSINSTLNLLDTTIGYEIVSDAIETLNQNCNPFYDIKAITREWTILGTYVGKVAKIFYDKTFDRTKNFGSIYSEKDFVELVEHATNIYDIGVNSYDDTEKHFDSDIGRYKLQHVPNPEYVDGYRSPIEKKIGSGIKKIKVVSSEQMYKELDKMIFSSETMINTGILDKICNIIMHHISEGAIFTPNTQNYIKYHYLSEFDDPSISIDVSNTKKEYITKKIGSILLQNLSCNNDMEDNYVFINGKTGKNICNTYVHIIEKILSFIFSFYDSKKSIMTKMWYTKDQGTTPDITSGDISVSMLCDKIFCINFTTIKLNTELELKKNSFDLVRFLNNVTVMSSIIDTEKFFATTEKLPSDTNKVITDDNITIIYEKGNNNSLKEKLLSEFNIRKNIFDVACLGFNPYIKYGSINRSFINKLLWSHYEKDYHKRTELLNAKDIYYPKFSHSILKLKNNLWSFYEHWYSQDIVTPQTFILFSKMRKNIKPFGNIYDSKTIKEISKSSLSYFDHKYMIPKTGSDTMFNKNGNFVENDEPLNVTNLIHEIPCDIATIINIKKSRVIKNIYEDHKIDTFDSKLTNAMNNFQFNLNMSESDYSDELEEAKKDYLYSVSKKNEPINISISKIDDFFRYADFVTSHSHGRIETLHQQTIPSGYDIDSFEHPYQCYVPLLKPKSKIASLTISKLSSKIESTEYNVNDQEYILPIFTIGRPTENNVEEFFDVPNSSFINKIEYKKLYKHKTNMNVLESNYNTRLSDIGFPEPKSTKNRVSDSFVFDIFHENFDYGYFNSEIDDFKDTKKGGLVDISEGTFSPFMNYGIGIISVMNIIASLWLICMTAKLDSLMIYKPMDLLKIITGKWKILSGQKKTFSKNSDNKKNDSTQPFGWDKEKQIKILTQNQALYDLFEPEFSGISNLAMDEIKTESIIIKDENMSLDNIMNETNIDKMFKKHSQTSSTYEFDQSISERNISRVKEAIEYIFMLPDLYRQSTNQILSKEEQEFINNSQKTLHRNIELIRETETIEPKNTTRNSNTLNAEDTIEMTNKILETTTDYNYEELVNYIDEGFDDEKKIKNIQMIKNSLVSESLKNLIIDSQEKKSIESIQTANSQLKIVKDELKVQNKTIENEKSENDQYDLHSDSDYESDMESEEESYQESGDDENKIKKDRDTYDDIMRKKIMKKITHQSFDDIGSQIENLDKVTEELTKITEKKNEEIQKDMNFKVPLKNFENKYNEMQDEINSKIEKSYITKKIEEIENSSSNQKISVSAILYSCLSRPDGMDNISTDLPYYMDSFNSIYTIIKLMETGGIVGNINKRPLDTGSGLSGNVLINAGSDYFQNLLDESVSTRSAPFWDCLPSKSYELGIMDTLVSNQ